jgi:hypothetical protein
VTQEEAAKMAGGHAEGEGELLHCPAVVEKAALDEPEGP